MSSCCVKGARHEGDSAGRLCEVYGLETYEVGAGTRVIVVLTDIYGHRFKNVQLIADQIAEAGYRVLVPDILQGDAVERLDGSVNFGEWLERHGPAVTGKIVAEYMQRVREGGASFVGVTGYCFGAKYAVQQVGPDGYADACAVAHPSFLELEEVARVRKPILISAAETDPQFPAETRWAAEKELAGIGATYQIDLFSGVTHGFAVRGDLAEEAVRYAMGKVVGDQICWMGRFAK
ncbi:AaceriADR406Wp [[Ashbya] aceris (nom. inval.)]|nr:AaceriADR406Wp [[Ashbya] aceris (nom. inval.)]